jgi:hypothetical protein|nr:MAG TPA: Transcription factor HY5 leucine zipper, TRANSCRIPTION.0A [Bacteriophage sp.]
MDENKITIIDYVEKKLSAEIAELKVLLAKTEFKAFALQEENERLKAQLAEKEKKSEKDE